MADDKLRFIRVRRAKWGKAHDPRRNWLVEDYRPPKTFIRVFTFAYFDVAIREADRLARTGLINPTSCFGVQRVEYRDA